LIFNLFLWLYYREHERGVKKDDNKEKEKYDKAMNEKHQQMVNENLEIKLKYNE